MAGRRSEGLFVCLFASPSSSSSSVFSTRFFFERTIFFRRYEGKEFYIITTRKGSTNESRLFIS